MATAGKKLTMLSGVLLAGLLLFSVFSDNAYAATEVTKIIRAGQSISSISRSGNVVTVTMSANYPNSNIKAGQSIVVSGVSNSSFNGTFTVSTVADQQHFTYSQAGDNESSSGGTAGGDYTSLTSWVAGEQKNLVSSDEIAIAECYNDWAAGLEDNVTIDGFTTDSTRYIKVTSPEGERPDGQAGVGFCINPLSDGDAVVISDDYTVFEYAEVKGWQGADSTDVCGIKINADNVTVEGCVVHDPDSGALKQQIGILAGNYTSNIFNNIVYNIEGTAKGYGISAGGNGNKVYNNTVYNALDNGIIRAGGSPDARNNHITLCGMNYNINGGSWGASTNYNLSSSASATGGADDVLNVAVADEFVSIASGSEDLHLKTGADAIGAGQDLSATFTDDCDVQTRSGDWDIGADQIGCVWNNATGNSQWATADNWVRSILPAAGVPVIVDYTCANFTKVWVYDGATYENVTDQAGNGTEEDIFHSATNALLKDTGDILYIGRSSSFTGIYFELSTPRTGGDIVFEYWVGAYSFWNTLTTIIEDTTSSLTRSGYIRFTVPPDWGTTSVNGSPQYYIRARATSNITTGPVGTALLQSYIRVTSAANNLLSFTANAPCMVYFEDNSVADDMAFTVAGDITLNKGEMIFEGDIATDCNPATPASEGTGWVITADNITVESSAGIRTDGLGFGDYVGQRGPGAGATGSSGYGSGAGYGSAGGNSSDGGAGGATYGIYVSPRYLGSKGGGSEGGESGGALWFNVAGSFVINGRVSADGNDASSGNNGGGGSGGSITIITNVLFGSGTISANGGAGDGNGTVGGGGGGAGRIYIERGNITIPFSGTAESNGGAAGGTAAQSGGSNDVFYTDSVNIHTYIWDNGSGDGLWSNPLNWDRKSGVPGPGDAVVFKVQGAVGTTANCTADVVVNNLGSITLESTYTGILYLNTNFVGDSNELTISGDLTLNPGTRIICKGETDGVPVNGLGISIKAANINIAAASTIDAYMQGFLYLQGPGKPSSSYRMDGAAHGGYGGRGERAGTNTKSYGSITQPTSLGSGGGYYTGGSATGGGAIKLTASGTITLNGTINADAQNSTGDWQSGAAGGSIWLDTPTLTGSGTITAIGGQEGNWQSGCGGGGGGRIAVYYTTNNFTGTITARGGYSATGSSNTEFGGAGTIYLKKTGEEPEIVVEHGATYNAYMASTLVAEDFTLKSLAVRNNAKLVSTCDFNIGELSVSGNASRMTHTGDITAEDVTVNNYGALYVTGSLYINNSINGQTGPDYTLADNYSATIKVTNSFNFPSAVDNLTLSKYYLEFMKYNSTDEFTLDDTLELTNSSSLVIQGDLTAINEPSGGTPEIPGVQAANPHGTGVTISAANITIDATSKISADERGFPMLTGPGKANSDYRMCGATHGGRGGRGERSSNSVTAYGIMEEPTALGSGGGYYNGGTSTGGGAFKLVVSDTLTVNGTLSANAKNSNGEWQSGGAGGSIWINTPTLAGSGMIMARGGNPYNYGSGSGAGGRIAVYYTDNGFTGTISARAGQAYANRSDSYYGGAGTIYFKQASQTNFDLVLDNEADNPYREGAYLTGNHTIDNLTIANSTGLIHTGSLTVDNIDIDVRSFLTNTGNINVKDLSIQNSSVVTNTGDVIAENLVVQSSSQLIVTGSVTVTSSINGQASSDYTLVDGSIMVTESLTYPVTPNILTLSNFNLKQKCDLTLSTLNLTNGSTYSFIGDTGSTYGTGHTITADNITIDAGCSIHADRLGFPPGQGPSVRNNYRDYGSAHGGYGGYSYNYSYWNQNTYGSLTQPTALGTGGSSSQGTGYTNEGGGAIKFNVAGTLTINGYISACAGNSGNEAASGGTGGSIWIITGTLAGSGTIRANGGYGGTYSGSGSGGRIAAHYTTDNFSGNITAYGGNYSGANSITYTGGAGTIYKKQAAQSNFDLIIDNNNYYETPTPLAADYTIDNLNVRNLAYLYSTGSLTIEETLNDQAGPGYTLTDGTIKILKALTFPLGIEDLTLDNFNIDQQSLFTLPGDLSLTTASNIYFYPDSGLGAILTLGGNLNIETSSNMYFYGKTDVTDGLGGTINAGNVTVDPTSRIYVGYNYGFPGSQGPGKGQGYRGGGSSHGGWGGEGYNRTTLPGKIYYGSLTEPTSLGSGSGYSSAAYGGGAIKIAAGTVAIDGYINATGRGNYGTDYPGASGGSIYIDADTLTGSGYFEADGGAGGQYSGGAGGGKISINASSYSNSLSYVRVAGGLNGSSVSSAYLQSESGTIVCAPIGGYSDDNEIPAGQITQETDGSGVMTVNFKIKDAGDQINNTDYYKYRTGDTQVYDGGNGWSTADKTLGSYANICYYDVNGNGKYDTGEDIWTESISVNRIYDRGETQTYDGGNGWETPEEAYGKKQGLYYNGDDIWAKAGLDNENHTLSGFEYSVDGGETWNAPVNGDASACLTGYWQADDQDYNGPFYEGATLFSNASEYSFTWNTKHADLSGLDNVDQDDIKIRFKIKDWNTQGVFPNDVKYYLYSKAYTVSAAFRVDNLAPDVPSTPDLAAEDDLGVSDSDNYTNVTENLTFTGTAEADMVVRLYDGALPVGSPGVAAGGNYSIDIDLADGEHYISAKTVDLVGNASPSSSAVTVTIKTSAPELSSVMATSLNNAGDTIELTFNEAMDTSTIENGCSTIVIEYCDDALGANTVVITAANATVYWTGNLIATVTLDESVDGAYIPDGKYVRVTPNADSVKDLAGNSVENTPVYTANAISKEAIAPSIASVVGTSIHAGGDTIVVTFSEPMDTSTLTDGNVASNIEIDYSDNAGNINEGDIVLNNATVEWDTARKVATITLDEATDGAFIPSYKYIGVTPVAAAVKDLVGNTVPAAEIYTSSPVERETTAPAITVSAVSRHAAGDIITITSNEVLRPDPAVNLSNWLVQYDDNNTAGGETTFTTANAQIALDSTGKIVTVTLDESVDGAYIPDGKYVKVTPNSNIRDLIGNSGVQAKYSSSPIAAETIPPLFSVTAQSVHSGGDTITLTFDEAMNTASVANGCATLNVAYTDNTLGDGRVDITVDNATVNWDVTRKIAVITLNEETDGAYIPNGKYIEVNPVADSVLDLVGNAAVSYERYTASAVSKENIAPTITNTAPATNAKINNARVTYTLSETCASGTITWTRTGGTADPASPHACTLVGEELYEGAHTDITLNDNPSLVGGAIYSVRFNATDFVGNTATPVTNTNITCDITAVVISNVSPSSTATVKNANISYTLSEDASSVTITWTRTGGEADINSPHVSNLSGDNLLEGAHTDITLTGVTLVNEAVYTVTFEASDLAENPADPVSSTLVVCDMVPPSVAVTITKANYSATTWNETTTINGTSSDSRGISGVEISVKREDGTTDHYWDGEDWDATAEQWLPATTGTTTWRYTLAAANLANGRMYTVRARATDNAGNVTLVANYASDTFTYTPIVEVSGITDPVTAGDENDAIVSIKDYLGNLVTEYVGVMRFTSTDTQAVLPSNYQFELADAGDHTFSGLILKSAGEQSVTVTDTAEAVLTDIQSDITVLHASADHLKFQSNVVSPQDVGVEFDLGHLQAVDLYGNVVNGTGSTPAYNGTKTVGYVLSGGNNAPNGSATDSYTTSVSFADGASVTVLNTTLYRYQSITITAYASDLADYASGRNIASNSVTVRSGSVSGLYFYQQPSSYSLTNVALAQQPKVAIADEYGNPCMGETPLITLSASASNTEYDPDINGTLTATALQVIAQDGLAEFSGVKYNYPEDIYLRASTSGVDDIYSSKITFINAADGTLTAGALAEPATISSAASSPETKVQVFDFKVTDSGSDGASINITRIIITRGATDTTEGWSDYIAGASLFDGTTTVAGTITDNALTFGDGINVMYTVSDNSNKTYTLSIYLKSTLPADADGKTVAFDVDPNDDIGVKTPGSLFTEGNSITSSSVVDIIASQFTVTGSVSLVAAGQESLVYLRATDTNYNTDIGYEGVKSIVFSGANESVTEIKPSCTNYSGVTIDFGDTTLISFNSGESASAITMKLYKAEAVAIKAGNSAGTITTSDSDDLEIVVTGGVPGQLLWGTQPESTVVANSPWKTFTVNVTDAYGNTTPSSINVTATPTGGAWTPGSAYIATANSGVARFTGFAVYCADYPRQVTVNATATGVAETGASGAVTVVEKYAVTLKVLDQTTASALTEVRVTVFDADTGEVVSISDADNPMTGNSPFSFSLPYGSYNFKFEKDAYVETTVGKIADTSADALDGIYDNEITWSVYITSIAETLADYKVMSDFVYDENNDILAASLRLEKRGQIVTSTPSMELKTATINIYDGDTLIGTITDAAADELGNYWFALEDPVEGVSGLPPAGMTELLESGKSYFARCSIAYGDLMTYYSGTTFTIPVAMKMKEVTDSIQAMSTEIKAEVAGVKQTVTAEANKVQDLIGDDDLISGESLVSTLKREHASRILTQQDYVQQNNTLTVQYKTDTGLSPTITVYDSSGAIRINKQAMKETVAGSGIYEYDVRFIWGRGQHTIVCEEAVKGTVDGIHIEVISTDLEDISSTATNVQAQLSNIDTDELGSLTTSVNEINSVITRIISNIDELTNLSAQVKDLTDKTTGAIYDQLEVAMSKLREINEGQGVKLERMYDMSEDQSTDVDYIRNKTLEIKSLVELSQDILSRTNDEPIVKTWMESGE
ncbi:Ig-like domain-containing protein [bacterium]|jgi:archaellum component FlaC|nr:Ig-like domain-containing protein [bacterium]